MNLDLPEEWVTEDSNAAVVGFLSALALTLQQTSPSERKAFLDQLSRLIELLIENEESLTH